MGGAAGSSKTPDALDRALAAPVRSLPSLAGIGAASVLAIAVLAALGWLLFLRPGSDRGGEPVGPIARAPVVLPANEGQSPKREEKSIEPAPPSPVTRPAVVGGTVRDENGEPTAFADVYLAYTAKTSSRDEDRMGSLGSFFRADYFKRSRFLETRTDREGRYRFEGIREFGSARLGGFKENHATLPEGDSEHSRHGPTGRDDHPAPHL